MRIGSWITPQEVSQIEKLITKVTFISKVMRSKWWKWKHVHPLERLGWPSVRTLCWNSQKLRKMGTTLFLATLVLNANFGAKCTQFSFSFHFCLKFLISSTSLPFPLVPASNTSFFFIFLSSSFHDDDIIILKWHFPFLFLVWTWCLLFCKKCDFAGLFSQSVWKIEIWFIKRKLLSWGESRCWEL